MAEEKPKLKFKNLPDILNSLSPATGNLEKDYAAYTAHLDSGHQANVLQLAMRPLFNDLYNSMMQKTEQKFGSDIKAKLHKDTNKPEATRIELQKMFNEYVQDFLKGYQPEILDGIKDIKDDAARFNALSHVYDTIVGAGREGGTIGIAQIVESLVQDKDATVGSLRNYLEQIFYGDERGRGKHIDSAMFHLNSRVFRKYMSTHEGNWDYHKKIIKELDRHAAENGLSISEADKVGLYRMQGKQLQDYHRVLAHGQKSDILGLLENTGYKKPEKKK